MPLKFKKFRTTRSISRSSVSVSSSGSSLASSSFPITRRWKLKNKNHHQSHNYRHQNNHDDNNSINEFNDILLNKYTHDKQQRSDTIFGLWPKRSLTLPIGKKLVALGRESKNLLVKSVSSANTFVPTTMTCIKSPRAMSENLLGQQNETELSDGFFTMTSSKSAGHQSKYCNDDNLLRKCEKTTPIVIELPSTGQRWSSIRVKGESTKSLLVENGGIPMLNKGTLPKDAQVGFYYSHIF